MDGLAATPGKANYFRSVMIALSKWARVRDHIDHPLAEGVDPYSSNNGHRPWTDEQISIALKQLSEPIRKGIMLYLFTGMRGSDVVRLGWTDIDDGGFSITAQKRKVAVWCPIAPELLAEMETWERRPGPFLLRDTRKPFTRQRFSEAFAFERDKIPELLGVTLHGLRCTAVIRLRRLNLTTGQIGNIVAMSLATIERYCRFADRKIEGQAALLTLNRTSAEQNCKTMKNSKPK
jgi:integrase